MPHQHDSVATPTKSHIVIPWLQKVLLRKHLWPYLYCSTCCGIQLESLFKFENLSELGVDHLSCEPIESDLLIISGVINLRSYNHLIEIYERMQSPKWVLSVGSCASTGGIFNSYCVYSSIPKVINVDLHIPGCPPSLGDLKQGIANLRNLINKTIE